MSPEIAARALGADWRALVRKNGTKEFADGDTPLLWVCATYWE
jgi:hypothetical protein